LAGLHAAATHSASGQHRPPGGRRHKPPHPPSTPPPPAGARKGGQIATHTLGRAAVARRRGSGRAACGARPRAPGLRTPTLMNPTRSVTWRPSKVTPAIGSTSTAVEPSSSCRPWSSICMEAAAGRLRGRARQRARPGFASCWVDGPKANASWQWLVGVAQPSWASSHLHVAGDVRVEFMDCSAHMYGTGRRSALLHGLEVARSTAHRAVHRAVAHHSAPRCVHARASDAT
jgi:hypothetical protein